MRGRSFSSEPLMISIQVMPAIRFTLTTFLGIMITE